MDKLEKLRKKYRKYPKLDIDNVAFESDEQRELAVLENIQSIRMKTIARFIVPVLSVCIFAFIAISGIGIYTLGNQEAHINSLTAKIKDLTNENSTLKTKNDSLSNSNASLQSANDSLSARVDNLENDIAEDKLMDFVRDHSIDRETYEATVATPNQRQQSNHMIGHSALGSLGATQSTKEPEKVCAYPDCNSSPERGSYYCYQHECSKSGCHEMIANDYSRYCYLHKCFVPDCNQGQALNNVYCIMHSR